MLIRAGKEEKVKCNCLVNGEDIICGSYPIPVKGCNPCMNVCKVFEMTKIDLKITSPVRCCLCKFFKYLTVISSISAFSSLE